MVFYSQKYAMLTKVTGGLLTVPFGGFASIPSRSAPV